MVNINNINKQSNIPVLQRSKLKPLRFALVQMWNNITVCTFMVGRRSIIFALLALEMILLNSAVGSFFLIYIYKPSLTYLLIY